MCPLQALSADRTCRQGGLPARVWTCARRRAADPLRAGSWPQPGKSRVGQTSAVRIAQRIPWPRATTITDAVDRPGVAPGSPGQFRNTAVRTSGISRSAGPLIGKMPNAAMWKPVDGLERRRLREPSQRLWRRVARAAVYAIRSGALSPRSQDANWAGQHLMPAWPQREGSSSKWQCLRQQFFLARNILLSYTVPSGGLDTVNKDSKLARLRDLLWQMEVEVGLEKLSQPQRDVYYVACLVADSEKLLHSEQIRHHPIVQAMARPTFYRALRDLVEQGYLVAASEIKNGRYKIVR